MTETVYFLVDLPPDFAVEDDLLGTSWDVSTPLNRFTVRLPRRPQGGADTDLDLRGPDFGGAEAVVEDWFQAPLPPEHREHPFWGGVQRADLNKDRIEAAPLHRALATTTYHGSDLDAERFAFATATGVAIATWVSAVGAWLEVVSGRLVSFSGVGPQGGPTRAQRFPLVIDVATQGAEEFTDMQAPIMLTYREPAAMTLADFRAAVAHVVAARVPPLAHRLLRDARAAERTDDHRRAVIDAATACEVALTESIRARLSRSLPSRDVDQLIERRRGGLMELYDYRVAAVGPIAGVSWGRLSDQLARLRNDVAHAGHEPTEDDVHAAIHVAAELLREMAPLPVP